MRYALVSATLIASVAAHGLVLAVTGANGVSMPGLSVADGTPRDCSSPGCGSEADTSIIRDNEIGTDKASALGRTEGSGPVEAANMIGIFMGNASSASATSTDASSDTGNDNFLSGLDGARRRSSGKRGLLSGLLGGGGGDDEDDGTKTESPQETSVAAAAGKGAVSGLPTASDDGEVTLVYRQINQDGAGPVTADIDSTSGGTDPNAFQTAEVTQDVPGSGIGGLSLATNTDFPLKVAMPAGMTCEGTSAGVKNVCVVRVKNAALAGPFGGSAAFTQSAAGRKRAIAYRLKKRMEINRHY